MKWNLRNVSYSDLSSIRYEAQVCRFEPDNLEALLLTFSGRVPEGSAGNHDARFMSFITGQFVVLTLPDCVVFDLRDLAYTFGSSLLGLPQAAETELEGLPSIFVASEKCRAGLTSLLAPTDTDTSAFLFDDLDSALQRAQVLAREYDAKN